MKESLGLILAKMGRDTIAGPLVVSYCCLNETTGRTYLAEQTEREIKESGVLRVMVPCVARLGAVDLVTPFELGADRVAVIACRENGCFYTGAEDLLKRRIRSVKGFLDEIGVGGLNLHYFQTVESAEKSWPGFWEAAKRNGQEA
jgi:coenzyme F420-reducing hydrogenase delta subunit